jgi:hypothetical protein
MEIIIIATVFLLWIVLGGIVAILVCPLLKQASADPVDSPSLEQPRKITVPRAASESYR